MIDSRPDPDALLKRVLAEEHKEKRGRLKVFLGASAGVGKTYAMLNAAHELLNRGTDVVAGLIETHGRKETEALLEGVPRMHLRPLNHRGVNLYEFDLDGALARKPGLLIVDELAHTNAPGSRHPKRWQDVQELLDAGICVYTAMNVQHIESLNDVVAQISGVQVKETVPDAFLGRADEIELIDIPPDELRQRLQEGKVYVAEQIDKALDGFFNKRNLIALRELALRRVADHVDAEMQAYREGDSSPSLWGARERVLVCVAPNRLGEKVVRAAARIGTTAHAQLYALFVESDRQNNRSSEQRQFADDALRLSEELGMETARRSGHDIVGEILQYAASRNVTLIVVGKPIKPRWREMLFGSVVDELVRRSGEIGVHVITSDDSHSAHRPMAIAMPPSDTKDYVLAVAVTALITALGEGFYRTLPHESVTMAYLLGITFTASRTGIRAALACALLSVASYDFFFIPPRFTFSVSDAQYLPIFAIMFGVGILISSLTHRLKIQADEASARERRTSALYDVSRQMAQSRGKTEIATVAALRISEDFDTDAAVLLPNERKRLVVVARSRSHFENDHREFPVAQWCFENGKQAGASTDTLPAASGLYIPLIASTTTVGVLALRPHHQDGVIDPEQRTLLRTLANGLALALERAMLAKESHEARLEAESEKVRSALLSSVSHDIRSPLTAIAGAASALAEDRGNHKALVKTIFDESERLNRHVRNLLDMTRLESGGVQPNLDWNSIEEIVGGALARTEEELSGHDIAVDLQSDLPLVQVDGPLIEQALVNLLENAAKHTPKKTKIFVTARIDRARTVISVEDTGPGVSEQDQRKLFEKFHQRPGAQEGFGLGLAIVRAILRIHGGDVEYHLRQGGGSVFAMVFPAGENSPVTPRG